MTNLDIVDELYLIPRYERDGVAHRAAAEIERLRAENARLDQWRLNNYVDREKAEAALLKAVEPEKTSQLPRSSIDIPMPVVKLPRSAVEPSKKQAYWETHEAPHCPTCDCVRPSWEEMSSSSLYSLPKGFVLPAGFVFNTATGEISGIMEIPITESREDGSTVTRTRQVTVFHSLEKSSGEDRG